MLVFTVVAMKSGVKKDNGVEYTWLTLKCKDTEGGTNVDKFYLTGEPRNSLFKNRIEEDDEVQVVTELNSRLKFGIKEVKKATSDEVKLF